MRGVPWRCAAHRPSRGSTSHTSRCCTAPPRATGRASPATAAANGDRHFLAGFVERAHGVAAKRRDTPVHRAVAPADGDGGDYHAVSRCSLVEGTALAPRPPLARGGDSSTATSFSTPQPGPRSQVVPGYRCLRGNASQAARMNGVRPCSVGLVGAWSKGGPT